MIHLIRTDSGNTDFQALVRLLDADLRIRDGEEHAFFAQFNKIDKIRYVVMAFEDKVAVGCGAIKEYSPDEMEVKRMFVSEERRGQGIASKVLEELEKWARELHFNKCILETGVKQQEAIGLYEKSGYQRIPNYGQYKDVASSVCFEKRI